MKKIILFATVAALFSMAACQKEELNGNLNEGSSSASGSPVFTASISPDTKTTIAASSGIVTWESGDEIIIFDKDKKSATYHITNIDADGKATFVIKEGQTAIGDGPYTATYGKEPAVEQLYSETPGKLYMTAPETSGFSLTFTVQCGLMELNLTKAGESINKISVTGKPNGKSTTTYAFSFTTAQSIASEKAFYIAVPAGNYNKIAVTNASGNVCILNTKNDNGISILANHIKPVTLGEDKLIFLDGLVDMGVKNASGYPVYFRTMNLGASTPEENGTYFQWGGTTGHSAATQGTSFSDHYAFSWDNAPYHDKGKTSSSGWKKYIPKDKTSYWWTAGTPDGKTVLESDDDAAFKTDGEWRMPTKEEFNALYNACNGSSTPKPNGGTSTTSKGVYWCNDYNGAKGLLFIAKNNGPHLFFPAAGYGENSMLSKKGEYGYYWSSSLITNSPENAYCLYFTSGSIFADRSEARFKGFSVRPVSD